MQAKAEKKSIKMYEQQLQESRAIEVQVKGVVCAQLLKSVYFPRKFKGGMCSGSHLAFTYGGELLYLCIFS